MRYFVYFEGKVDTVWFEQSISHPTSCFVWTCKAMMIFLLITQPYRKTWSGSPVIKDEWSFTNDYSFEEVIASTQQMMLDHIRRIDWSPDGTLLAFASQNPGPSSDLYIYSPENGTVRPLNTDLEHVFNVSSG
jgi:hypothetical protein